MFFTIRFVVFYQKGTALKGSFAILKKVYMNSQALFFFFFFWAEESTYSAMKAIFMPRLAKCIDIFSLKKITASATFFSKFLHVILKTVRLIFVDLKLLTTNRILANTTAKVVFMIMLTQNTESLLYK